MTTIDAAARMFPARSRSFCALIHVRKNVDVVFVVVVRVAVDRVAVAIAAFLLNTAATPVIVVVDDDDDDDDDDQAF